MTDTNEKRTNDVNEKYYELFLYDPATPSFISIPKRYIGDKRNLMAVADQMEDEEFYPDTMTGIRSYFAGKADVMHGVAFQEIPVLRPVEVLERTELELGEKKWDHINTWGYTYHMHFRSATVSQLLISIDDLYHRFVRADITDFGYKWEGDDWKSIGGFIMGNAFVLDIQDNENGGYTLCNRLYVVEDWSKFLDEQKRKMHDPEAVIFDRICDEVFGDG